MHKNWMDTVDFIHFFPFSARELVSSFSKCLVVERMTLVASTVVCVAAELPG